MTSAGRRHIAIVGIAAELPSGVHSQDNLNPRTFWEFLLDKQDAFENIPQDRLNQISGSMPVPVGAFLKEPTRFDNVEFGISTKDALSMTASTRRLIELTFLAALDSGIDSRGKRIGVFSAGTNIEAFESDDVGSRGLGTAVNTLANRPGFVLDLTGPSLYIDTACSSTFTAMHLAVRSIESGDCDAAIVGGCQYNMNMWDWWSYSRAGVLSTDGKSQPFDAKADGLLKGEGAVSMVIKPLDAALVDNDHIYAVILGTSINSSGSRAPLHAPCAAAQQQCIRDAFADAKRDLTEVDFVELHATGTSVGDPIEANAAGELFARSTDVFIGSLKGNLGHLESSAFFASLLKVCLMLEHKIVPPNVNFNNVNPNIMWERYRLKVPTEAMPLECRSSTGRSLISLSSSGIGGSNGHMVVEGPPNVPQQASLLSRGKPVLFIVGGLSPRATQKISLSVVDMLNKYSSKEALSQAVTHSRRARQLPWRTYFIHTSGTLSTIRIKQPILVPSTKPPIVFVFTGQGPQHINMGRNLFATFDVFRESILEMDQIYENFTGTSLIKTTGLFDGENTSMLPPIWSVDTTSPAIAIVEMALFDLLVSVGVKPDILVGHSMGETPLLYASGACSKAMAVEVAIVRGKAMKVTEIGAGMAAVSCGAGRAALLIEQVKSELDGVLEIACLNSPTATVLSGSEGLVEKVVTLAQQDEIFARKLKSVTPGHTSIMENCRLEYESGLEGIFLRHKGPHKPVVPTYSSVGGHGKLINEFTPEYLWNNVRKHVAFHQAVTSILQDSPSPAFVEISPHPALSPYISALSSSSIVTCPMRRFSKTTSTESIAFTETLGVLTTNGVNSIDLTSLYGRASRDPAFHIEYPFVARHFPLRVEGPRELGGFSGGPCSQGLKMNAKTHPDLAEHVINGEPIVPAAAFIDMILQTDAKFLWDLEFRSILSLASETPSEVRVRYEGSSWKITTMHLSSHTNKITEEKVHVTGFSSKNLDAPIPNLDIKAILARLPTLEIHDFYENLKPLANFGPEFRRLRRLSGNEGEALAEVATFAKDAGRNYQLHPAILDACMHYALHPVILQNLESGATYLPQKIRKLAFYNTPKLGEPIYSFFVLQQWSPESRVADITVSDKAGSILCKLEGLELRKVSSASYAVKNRFDLLPQPVIIDAALPQYDHVWRRADKKDIDALGIVMDHLAVNIIKSSLKSNVVVGDEIHRQRYHAFAKSAVDRTLVPLPPAPVIEQLRSKYPPYFEVTNRIAQVHKDVFKSSESVVQVLFSDDLMERFYDCGYFGPICEFAVDVFQKTISSIAHHGKRVIRVLEVGAGTGLLTRYLCNSLKQRDDVIVQYVVSDVSFALANSAAKSASYKYTSAKTYDLFKHPTSQGFAPGSFDMVVGLHVLHATPDVSCTLSFVQQLLVGGGSLLIVELDKSAWRDMTPACLFHDFVFGSFPEWFDFRDGRDHCSLLPEDWHSSLLSSGYEAVQVSTGGGAELLFTAQKPPFDCTGSPRLDFPSPVFLTYEFGHEMDLQREVSRLDINQHLFLWLLAADGVDGAAVMGLAQTLILEFSTWKIQAAIFEGTPDETDRIDLVLRYQEYIDGDTAVRFSKDGLPHVFKVVPSSPPVSNHANWAKSLGVARRQIPPLQEHQVAVDISSWSTTFASWRGFFGCISQTKDNTLCAGDLVLGVVVDAPESNRIVCHSGQLTLIPSGFNSEGLTDYILAMVIAAIVLGPSRTSSVGPCHPSVRLFLPAQDELAKTLHDFLKLLPQLAYVEIDRPTCDTTFDWIVVDSATVMQRPEVAFWRGNVMIWDKVMREMCRTDPWSLGYSLQTILQLAAPLQSFRQSCMTYPQDKVSMPCEVLATTETSLFDQNKSYILLGGASDLGMHIALWMYQRGARYIVLTSRRGRRFMEESSTTPTRQRLSYLESREDLVFRVAACDATSLEATFDLLRTLEKPAGGCFSMTLALSDALFLNQTNESFRIVCDAKLKVLQVFEAAVSIEKLDFFVQFSSFASLSGNYGQSNYSLANSLVDGYLERYRNAFSLIVPAIRQVGYYARISRGGAPKQLAGLSISPEEICAHLEDGLLKLSQGTRCSRYIFDMPWDVVRRDLGLPTSARHLIPFENQDSRDSNTSQNQSSLINTVLNLLDVSLSDFSPNVPFVAYGLDSLGATRISEAIRPYVYVSQMQLLGGMTWKQLEDHVEAEELDKPVECAQLPSTEPMLRMVDKYCQDFGIHRPSKPAPTDEVILVTGTTGAVGASVLSELVQLATVRLVYAVNRRAIDGTNLSDRQKHGLVIRGLDPSILDSPKVILLEADLDLPDFGLTQGLMNQIRSSVTHIIHVSWMVNWAYGVEAYEPNIRATRHLIDLALSSPLPMPPRILFTSTIGVMTSERKLDPTTASPEWFVEPESSVGVGYSESKWVVERMFELAALKTPLRPIVVRTAQIAGSPNGYWKAEEWVPSIVESAMFVKCLPAVESRISWVPLDIAANIIVGMRNSSEPLLHVAHPHPIPWNTIFGRIASTLSVDLVSYSEWLARLESKRIEFEREGAIRRGNAGNTKKPVAFQLLDIVYRTARVHLDPETEAFLPKVSTEIAQRVVPSLASIRQLGSEDVDKWLLYWKSIGYIEF